MNDFKIGDICWFFYTNYGKKCWEDSTVVYPEHVEITQATIVDIEPKHDNVYLYVKGERDLVSIGRTHFEEWVYKSRNAAIDSFVERLKGMMEDLQDE